MISRYGRGYRPDPVGHKVAPFRLHPLARAFSGQIPANFDLGDVVGMAPIMDQDQTSSCTWHAAAVCLFPTLGFIASQDDGYAITRCIQQHDDGLPPDTDLTDEGAAPNEVVRAAQLWGVRPMVPKDEDQKRRNSDCSPGTINRKRFLDELLLDAKRLALGQFEVDSAEGAQVALLVRRRPISVAIFVDTNGSRSVEEWDPSTGPVDAPDTSDPRGGGHAVAIRGWRTDSRGRRIWRVHNSWGEGYGMDGIFEGTDAWFDASSNRYDWDCTLKEAA